jgi:hypothetical protein
MGKVGSLTIRLLVLVVVTTGLVGSCGSSDDNECQSVGAAYSQVLRDSALLTSGAAIEGEPLATASDISGAWYIVAKVDGSISVWVTDRDPRGETVGHIITGTVRLSGTPIPTSSIHLSPVRKLPRRRATQRESQSPRSASGAEPSQSQAEGRGRCRFVTNPILQREALI